MLSKKKHLTFCNIGAMLASRVTIGSSVATEVWLRRPSLYIRDALANGYTRYVFDREVASKVHMDVCSYMREMCLGVQPQAEYLLVGPQGAAHYDLSSVHQRPKAVYPVWDPSLPMEHLRALMEEPVSEDDPKRYSKLPPGLRPIPGQEHRVIVRNMGKSSDLLVQKLFERVNILLEEYPDCKVHLSGQTNYQMMFDYPYHSVDFDPTNSGAGLSFTRLCLPNGITMREDNKPEWPAYEEWVNLLGFQFLQVVKSRRILVNYNIASVHWAAKYFTSSLKVNMKWKPSLDEAGVPLVYFKPKETRTTHWGRLVRSAERIKLLKNSKDLQADFILCDWCMFRATCRLARVNSVCIYKGADTVPLADAFGSRNAGRIIDGLSDLLKKQADRTERAIAEEALKTESDPEVTKQINALFRNGTLLAKLLDPSLNGRSTTVNVGVAVNAGNAAAVAAADPKQLVSNAVMALEEQGFTRDEITKDMIATMLQNPGVPIRQAPPRKQIEGVIIPGPEVGP